MSGAPITVTAKELTATLDRRKLLHGVSFTLRPGKTTAIVGPPRSGKSLLLQTMAGRARVTGGSLLVKGIVPYRSRELTQDVCLIRSVGSFFGALSVRRTFDLYRANRPYWDEETAERLLHNFSLSLRALPENLSKADLHK